MKIFIMVDMEGISGICLSSQVASLDGKHYQQARQYLTWDVNACVEGCFAGGATEVIVRDCHGGGYHLIWEELDQRAIVIQGILPEHDIPDVESLDGLILLGYHAMAGTQKAILEHTMNSKGWQNFWINGRKSGEVALHAALGGEHGVPTIMVSGDDKVCCEARRFIKGVVTVEVKKGISCQAGALLPKKKAHALIRRGAAKAVRKCKSIAPYSVKKPVTLRLEVISRGRIPETRPYVRVIDGRTYEVKGDSVQEALNLLIR